MLFNFHNRRVFKKVARVEWVNVMRIIKYYDKLNGTLTTQNSYENSDNDNDSYLLSTIHKEIEETNTRLNKTLENNVALQDSICELIKSIHKTKETLESEQAQTADQLKTLQVEVCDKRKLITEKTKNYEDLEMMLNELKK